MSTARKILIVDDDEDLRELIKDQLDLHDEFEVEVQPTASMGLEAIKVGHYDLVIMDVGLPDMDGREAVKVLRKTGFKAPVVMLTANDSDADMILGLELWRQRLRHEAVQVRGAVGAHPGTVAPA